MDDYYVYVYIDPRNYEEFYYGKGVGSRKNAHLEDQSDSEKTKRIAAIRKEGLVPVIRVIARGLSEHDALLVEKTLLWKLGRWATNIATGHFADRFRPHNTFHKQLSGFDYQNAFLYYNVGDGPCRRWEDYIEFGFISAGQGPRRRDAMLGFNEGDAFVAYLKGKGFVGVGRIKSRAKRAGEITVQGRPLLQMPLKCPGLQTNCDDPEMSEYVCLVTWMATVPREEAKWTTETRLYTTPLVRASLDGQLETVRFIEQEFGVSLREIIA